MKNTGGRKSYFEELKIVERYSALTEPFFKVLKKALDSEDERDQKWAVEQLGKAYVKMIPQDITTGGESFNSVKEMSDAELEDIATGSKTGTSKT